MSLFSYSPNEVKKEDIPVDVIMMFRDIAGNHYRFLSNFAPCNVTLPEEIVEINGKDVLLPAMNFTSTEKAYIAWKTVDIETRKIIATMSSGEAKKFAHQEGFPLRPDYSDERRIEIMCVLIEQKFSKQNPDLRKSLLDTGISTIVEGNTWGDKFFGFDLLSGEGCNYLGQILMYVRDLARVEEGLSPVKESVGRKITALKSHTHRKRP